MVTSQAGSQSEQNRKSTLHRLALAAIAAVTGWAGSVGCVSEVPVFDPKTFNQGSRVSDDTRPLQAKRPLPGEKLSDPKRETVPPAPRTGGRVVRLPLQEIVQRAVANNTEIHVASFEPAVEESRIIEAEARFDPEIFSRVQYDNQYILSPSGGFFPSGDPFDPNIFRTLSGEAGVRGVGPTGAEYSASYRVQRIQRDPEASIDPYYTSDIVLRLTQPLLRDFGSDVNRARIGIARENTRVSLLQYRIELEEMLTNLERAYWQLVQAQHEVRIQQELLNRTVDTYNILYARFKEQVDVNRVQLQQALQSVQSRRAVLVRARARVLDLSDQVKRFMGDPEFPIAGDVIVLPATGALVEPIDFDLSTAVDTALQNRPELGQERARIEAARITQTVAENNLLPQLNLSAQATFQGVGVDFTGADGATAGMNDLDFITSSFGLEFAVPIGNRAAHAILNRTKLQRLQAMARYTNAQKDIEMEVSLAHREVETTWNEIVDRKEARKSTADALAAIIERRVNAQEPLTPTFVQLELDTQERLAIAEAEEQAAIANYNIAIARFERAKGTLLRYDNVVLEDTEVLGK